MFRTRVLPRLIWFVYRALSMTWRFHITEDPEFKKLRASGEPIVFAHWHGDELAILNLLGPYRGCAMVSTSKDGEIMDAVIRMIGGRTSRGSSTRGGVSALKGILKLAKDGWNPSVAVDGPKGPLHKVKPGVFEISRIVNAPIAPIAAAASNAHVFEKAWNKTFLPLPFSKVHVVFDAPIPAIGRDQDARDEQLASTLEQALTNARRKARKLIAT